MKLIVGLGNPGKQYEKTRHNIGFETLNALQEALASCQPSPWEFAKKFNADLSGCAVGGEKIVLAKPRTFMNDSGAAVAALAHFYKIPAREIIIVHDDKDIPLGELKVQTNRGSAGHNGVQSVIAALGTEDFTRVRVGIGSKNEKAMRDVPSFVLGRFGWFERKHAGAAVAQGADALRALIQPR